MSESVLADAQFSAVRVFRPFAGFESVYEGLAVEDQPIAIPGDLDQNAGNTGFSPNLLAGIPVPYGSKLTLWIPTVISESSPVSGLIARPYRYTVLWRLRNLRDFNVDRKPYHFPRSSEGEGGLFVVPAAQQTSIYDATPQTLSVSPGSDFAAERLATQEVSAEAFKFQSNLASVALTPTGVAADYQQGLAATGAGSNRTATFNVVQLDCMGDEMIILISRDPTEQSDTWSFSNVFSEDRGLSAFYGTNGGTREVIDTLGVYVLSGSNP